MQQRKTRTSGTTTITPMKARPLEEARREFQKEIDDCPECKALRALGEQPQIIEIQFSPSPRPSTAGLRRFRRPRWRDLKRNIRTR